MIKKTVSHFCLFVLDSFYFLFCTQHKITFLSFVLSSQIIVLVLCHVDEEECESHDSSLIFM